MQLRCFTNTLFGPTLIVGLLTRRPGRRWLHLSFFAMRTIAALIISLIHRCGIRYRESRESPLAVSLETLLCHAWLTFQLDWKFY